MEVFPLFDYEISLPSAAAPGCGCLSGIIQFFLRRKTAEGTIDFPAEEILVKEVHHGRPIVVGRFRLHFHGSGVYPANLCPLSSGVEFASLGEDFGQSVGESIKAAPGRAVGQGTPEHLDGVLSEQEGIGNTIQACPR